MTRKLLTLLLILTILVSACSPPISGDAGTGYNPTPNTWGETVAGDLEQVTNARATREAR